MLNLSVALALAGCGAAPTSGAAIARPAAPAQAAGAYRAAFEFVAYDAISAEERRVLEAADVRVGDSAGSLPMKGRALYEHLALRAPKVLANYLNQAAVLEAVTFEDGRSAMSYVQGLDELAVNHVIAVVDPTLKDVIARHSAKPSTAGASYVGPENSSMMHGKFDTSFRENRPYTSQQLSFSAADGFARVDIDVDEECPLAGSRTALMQHLLRAAKHELLQRWPGEQYGEMTEPDYIYRVLSLSPVDAQGKPNRVGRGITPRYTLKRPG